MTKFLKKFPMKKAEMISTARMANNPNIFIYNFYDNLQRASTLLSLSEVYLEPFQISKMGPFVINGFQSLNVLSKKLQLRRLTRL